jgi:hypothetical protein
MVRNVTGYVQIDPARFPGPESSATCLNEEALHACMKQQGKYPLPEKCGCKNGNEGMRLLTNDLRALGFKWGSYSNMAGCQVDECNVSSLAKSAAAGFIAEDAALYLDEWQSEYLMVDSVGMTAPAGKDRHAWQHSLISGWASTMLDYSKRDPPRTIIFHACHAGCGGAFTGPTLRVQACNASDPRQWWSINSTSPYGEPVEPPSVSRASLLLNGASGLCAGCTNGPCANDARSEGANITGAGLGLQACAPPGMGSQNQQFTLASNGQILRAKTNSCLAVLHPPGTHATHALGSGSGATTTADLPVTALRASSCETVSPAQQWTALPLSTPSHGGSGDRSGYVQLQSQLERGPHGGPIQKQCLMSASYSSHATHAHARAPYTYETAAPTADGFVQGRDTFDPWCTNSTNMWRTSTDVLQTWARVMMQGQYSYYTILILYCTHTILYSYYTVLIVT